MHHVAFDLLNAGNGRFRNVSKAACAHSLLVMNDDIYEEQTVHIILQQSSPFTPTAVGGQGLFSSSPLFFSSIPRAGSRPWNVALPPPSLLPLRARPHSSKCPLSVPQPITHYHNNSREDETASVWSPEHLQLFFFSFSRKVRQFLGTDHHCKHIHYAAQEELD